MQEALYNHLCDFQIIVLLFCFPAESTDFSALALSFCCYDAQRFQIVICIHTENIHITCFWTWTCKPRPPPDPKVPSHGLWCQRKRFMHLYL